MKYKTYINKILFLGLVISFVAIQPAYDKWEGLTWSNIKYGLDYISKIPEYLKKETKEADKALKKRYEESKIDEHLQDFSRLMAPYGNFAPELQSKLPAITTRATIKEIGGKIFEKMSAWLDPVANASQVAAYVQAGDEVGATKAAYSAALSGEFVTLCGVIGGCIAGPPGAAGGVVLGGIVYSEVIDPALDDVADETSNFLQDAQELGNNKTRRQRTNEVKKNKAFNVNRCSAWQRVYINGGERPHQNLYYKCKEYGIDIYDLCDTDPNKRIPGICGCNKPDDYIDTDGDGVYDCNDKCKDNPKLKEKGIYGDDGCQTEDDWRMEQIEAAGLKCSKYQDIKWNDKKNVPECVCQGGMAWSESENECIDEELADLEPVKSCWEIENARSRIKGEYRYCECIPPLVWADKKELKCVTCDDRYPGSIPANTKKGCACPKETKWVKDLNQCVDQKMLVEYCDNKLPGSVPGKKGCICPEGKEKSKKLNICVATTDANKTGEIGRRQIIFRIKGYGFVPHYGGGSYMPVGHHDVLRTLEEPTTKDYNEEKEIQSILDDLKNKKDINICGVRAGADIHANRPPAIWEKFEVTILRGPSSDLSSVELERTWKSKGSDGPSSSELRKGKGCEK